MWWSQQGSRQGREVFHPWCAGVSLWISLPNFVKKSAIIFKASSKLYVFDKYIFFGPYLLPWQPYKVWFLWRFMKKNIFCHISQTIADIITIFGRVQHIYPEIISVKFCAILLQKIWVIEVFFILWIFIVWQIINTKHWKSTTNLHSVCMLGGLLLLIKKYRWTNFILSLVFIIFKFELWNTIFSQMIKTMKITLVKKSGWLIFLNIWHNITQLYHTKYLLILIKYLFGVEYLNTFYGHIWNNYFSACLRATSVILLSVCYIS